MLPPLLPALLPCCPASSTTCASLHIRLHAGNTRVWNSAGVRPPHLPPPPAGCTTWVGDPALPPQDRGLRVLGSPLGTDEYVAAQLQHLSVQHRALLQLLPGIHDLQVSWLLLLFCASPRVHYCLRLHLRSQLCSLPNMTATFCAAWPSCSTLSPVMLTPCPSPRPRVPTCVCAMADLVSAPAAYFASWADSLGALRVREPDSCHVVRILG